METVATVKQKVKTLDPLSVVKEGKLVVDGLSFKGFERCVVDDMSVITANLEITAKLIHDEKEYLVLVPAEVVKMEGDGLNNVELELDTHGEITTPGVMFVIKEGELASNDYISGEIYISRGESVIRLAQLHDDWLTLKAWIRFGMRSKLG